MSTELKTDVWPVRGSRRQFMAATGFSMFTHGVWVPAILLFFHYGRGLPIAGTGAAMTLGGVASLVACSLLGVLEYAAFWAVDLLRGATWAVIAALAVAALLFTVSSMFSDVLPNAMVYDFAPERTSGRHSALITAGWSLAGVFCPMIYTALLDWHHVAPWVFSIVLCGLGAALFRSMARGISPHPAEAEGGGVSGSGVNRLAVGGFRASVAGVGGVEGSPSCGVARRGS